MTVTKSTDHNEAEELQALTDLGVLLCQAKSPSVSPRNSRPITIMSAAKISAMYRFQRLQHLHHVSFASTIISRRSTLVLLPPSTILLLPSTVPANCKHVYDLRRKWRRSHTASAVNVPPYPMTFDLSRPWVSIAQSIALGLKFVSTVGTASTLLW